MNIPTKDELLKQWGYTDPLIYHCYSMAVQQDLTDEEMWRLLVGMMADRHAHLEKVYKRLLEQSPPSPIIRMNV